MACASRRPDLHKAMPVFLIFSGGRGRGDEPFKTVIWANMLWRMEENGSIEGGVTRLQQARAYSKQAYNASTAFGDRW